MQKNKQRLCRQEIERFSTYTFEGKLQDVLNKVQNIYNEYWNKIGKPIKVVWYPMQVGGFTWINNSIGRPHEKELIFHNFVLELENEKYEPNSKEFVLYGYREHTEEELEYEKKISKERQENKRKQYEQLKKEFENDS